MINILYTKKLMSNFIFITSEKIIAVFYCDEKIKCSGLQGPQIYYFTVSEIKKCNNLDLIKLKSRC